MDFTFFAFPRIIGLNSVGSLNLNSSVISSIKALDSIKWAGGLEVLILISITYVLILIMWVYKFLVGRFCIVSTAFLFTVEFDSVVNWPTRVFS